MLFLHVVQGPVVCWVDFLVIMDTVGVDDGQERDKGRDGDSHLENGELVILYQSKVVGTVATWKYPGNSMKGRTLGLRNDIKVAGRG